MYPVLTITPIPLSFQRHVTRTADSMAQHLARIHGTEEDKVNCPFYFKIGACRHSDRCSRLHHKPAFSQTLLVQHLYRHPTRQAELRAAHGGDAHVDPRQAQEDFFAFFEDLYVEFSKFGRIEGMHVVDNLGDHMIGHVYVKFADEEQASDALQVMNGRYYDGRPMIIEFSPVTDFREARCRDYDEDQCARQGYCNFLHSKPVPRALLQSLEDDCEADRIAEKERRRRDRKTQKKRKHRDRSHSEDRSYRKHGRSDRHRDGSVYDSEGSLSPAPKH